LVCHLLDQGIISPEDIAINIDGDGQHDPNYIPQLIEEFSSKNADIILARRDFSLYPYYKRIGNKGFAILASILTSFPYKDVNSNYRLMRAEIVPVLMGYLTGYRQSGSLEVGIITALLKYKIDNSFVVSVPLYIKGAKFWDGFHVLFLGLLAFLRVKFRIRSNSNRYINDTLKELIE